MDCQVIIPPKAKSNWLSGWSYRRPFYLSRASGAVTNYQMALTINRSSGKTSGSTLYVGTKCLDTYNDIRITKADGTSLLDYWLESSSTGKHWIECDSIGTSDTAFYAYYGKADASAVSSGANTFLLFDDFAGSSIDSTLWTTTTYGSGSLTVSGGECTFACTGANDRAKITSKTNYGVNTAIRSKVKTNKANSQDVNMRYGYLLDTPTVNRIYYFGNWKQSMAIWSNIKEGSVTSINDDMFTANTYGIIDHKRNSTTSTIFDFNGTTKATHTTNVPTGDYPFVCDANNGAYSVTFSIVLDWVLVRQFLSTEPDWGTWGDEEAA